NAGRNLGLHRIPAHHAGRPRNRRESAQGADARAEERLLLCRRSHQRAAHQRRAVHSRRQLGKRIRSEDRASDRESGVALLSHRQAVPGGAFGDRGAQLAAHGLFAADRAGVHPRSDGGRGLSQPVFAARPAQAHRVQRRAGPGQCHVPARCRRGEGRDRQRHRIAGGVGSGRQQAAVEGRLPDVMERRDDGDRGQS
ncbi:hypothetical protein LTR94_031242, partial [Friedmanniomyces endolithicus]